MPVRPLPVLRTGLVALSLLSGAALTAAHAADMPDFGYAPPPTVQEFGSSWYLRGDIGYSWQNRPGAQVDFVPVESLEGFGFLTTGTALDDTWTFGGGFGVRVNEWLRFDATADYRPGTDGAVFGAVTFDGGLVPDGNLDSRGSISSTLLLANAYVDLGTWNGFTPYVGAGIGAGYVAIDDLKIHAGEGLDMDGAFFHLDDGRWAFAWALMAGASFEVGPGWLIDVGYRYSSIERTGFSGYIDGFGDFALDLGSIDAQEVRIGMRYMID